MAFSPVEASKNITDKYYRYLKTSFNMGEPYKKEFGDLIDSNVFAKGPYLDVTDAFCKGHSLTELIEEGILPKSFSRINMNMTRPLYLHQEKAIRKIAQENRNLVVSTGTGSGKTESFLIPVLRHLAFENENGTLGAGVRALLVYPMNALANDQVERLRDLLKACPEITYGVYTGQTKHITEDALSEYKLLNDNKKPQPNELISREQMIATPPNILITNYAMLEYLMLRPRDNVFFDGKYANKWKFIVFDEAHVYNGSTGIEVSMLFRRLKAKLYGQDLTYILTSATLGSEKEDELVAKFAHNLCNAPFGKNDIIRADRIEPSTKKTVTELPLSFYADVAAAKNDLKSDSEILGIIGADKNGSLDESLYDLIVHDENYWKIRTLLKKPRTVRYISKNTGWTESQVTDFVTTASLAQKNGAKLFDAKYHMFIRATESVFVTLAPHNRVFIDRRNFALNEENGELYKVFEAATCSYCSSVYLVGKVIDKRLEYFNSTDEITQKDIFLLGANVNDTDNDHLLEDEGFKAEPYLICPYCGYLRSDKDKVGCEHNPSDAVRVFRASNISERKNLTKCLSCENVNHSGVLRMFFSGQEAATSVIGTALFEELPSYEVEVIDKEEETDEFGFGFAVSPTVETAKKDRAKQFIAFSDSRQAAAFYSSYLTTSYNSILYRRVILEAMKDVASPECSVKELVDRVHVIFDKYGVKCKANTDDEYGVKKEAWKAVLSELVDNNGNNSLSSMGLIGINADVKASLAAYKISEDEFRHICSAFVLSMLADAAINYEGAPLSDNDLEDFTHGGVKSVYTLSDSSGKLRKSFLPSKDGLSNKRMDYIQRIISKKHKLNPAVKEIDYDTTKRLLEAIWDKVLLRSEIAVSTGGNSYEISCKKIKISAPKRVYICSKCKKITSHNVENICPTYHCDGELQPIDRKEVFSDNHYFNIYNNLDIRDLRVVEHTAQLDRDMAYDYQKKFKQKQIDVLSCSTTFEMGVDVGSLETVFMRNMPPLPSNYAQRAGRAGRSSQSAAFALTFCNKSSHDFSYFNDPTMMIKGKINPPQYTVENDRIAIRHLYASAFSYFWKLNERYFGTIKTFLDETAGESGYEKLKRYFNQKPEDLRDYILKFIPEGLSRKYDVENFGWIDSLIGDNGALTLAVESYKYELGTLVEHQHQMYSEGKNVGGIQQRVKVYEREDILSFLSRKNVLPKYGFPVDTVEMSVSDKLKGTSMGLQLQRDLSVAISEYAPGSQIVANNNLITSRYIKKIPRIGWKTYSFIRCDYCNTLNTRPFTDDDGAGELVSCCRCGRSFEQFPQTFIIPEQGFVADNNSIRKPGLKKPERTYRGEISYVGSNNENDIVESNHYPIGKAIIEVKTSHNDEMAVLNTNPFYICEQCGYAVLDKKRFTMFKEEKHKNSSSNNCSNKTLKKMSLGYRFLTDVVQIKFVSHEINNFGEGLSVLYGLLRGICLSLNIEEGDVSGCLQSYPTSTGLNFSLVFFDKTPGGAGHVKRLNDQKVLHEVLNQTLKLMKGCICGGDDGDSSCYSCLRTYGNQKYHDFLKRKYVVDFLEEII